MVNEINEFKELTGTREIIFDVAIELISDIGFDATNMRLIANRSKIRASSIYNHFCKKSEILDCIYNYYVHHFFDNLKPLNQMKQAVNTLSPLEIIKQLSFVFSQQDKVKYRRMVLISKIIYMRIFQDERARQIFNQTMTVQPQQYVKQVLDYGVECGRFLPFDTDLFSYLLNGSRHIMGITAFASNDYSVQRLDIEDKIDEILKNLIPLSK